MNIVPTVDGRLVVLGGGERPQMSRIRVVDPAREKVLYSTEVNNATFVRSMLSPTHSHLYIVDTVPVTRLRGPELFGSQVRWPESLVNPYAGEHRLTVIDMTTGNAMAPVSLGNHLTPIWQTVDSLFSATQSHKTPSTLQVWQLYEGEGQVTHSVKTECSPDLLAVDTSDRITVFCKDKLVHFDAQRSVIEPLETAVDTVQLLDDETLLFWGDRGRFVGKLTVRPFNVVTSRLRGRSRLPFLSRALMVGREADYRRDFHLSDVVVDQGNNRLFALNHLMEDLVVLDASTLERVGLWPIHDKVPGLAGAGETGKLYAIARNHVTLFDTNQRWPVLRLSSGRLLGVNERSGQFYWQRKSGGFQIFSLKTRQSQTDLSGLGDIYAVVSGVVPGTAPTSIDVPIRAERVEEQ
ncbi:MAG: hypothetical protein AAF525_14500 [Pseudomonadota bacterium]